MRGLIRNPRNLTPLVVIGSALAGFAGWELAAPIRGQLVARLDVMLGHYKVLHLGLAPAWRPEYARLLRERYGIEERVVAGCVASDTLLAYVEAYNQVSMPAANRKFGHDVFEETAADASMNWKLRHTSPIARE